MMVMLTIDIINEQPAAAMMFLFVLIFVENFDGDCDSQSPGVWRHFPFLANFLLWWQAGGISMRNILIFLTIIIVIIIIIPMIIIIMRAGPEQWRQSQAVFEGFLCVEL